MSEEIEPLFDSLVELSRSTCPDCGGALVNDSWDQLPLIRHGGYGAASRTVLRHCPGCGWRLIVEHGEVRP